VILNLFVLEEGEQNHQWTGYAAVALVAFRSIWFFLGSPASGPKGFPLRFNALSSFVHSTLRREDHTWTGHNPLAAISYILFWMLILSLGTSGFMMGLDRFFGDEWLEHLHGYLAVAVQVFIGVHVIGISVDAILHRRKTWMGMIDGQPTSLHHEDQNSTLSKKLSR
jgi:cytochrome b